MDTGSLVTRHVEGEKEFAPGNEARIKGDPGWMRMGLAP